MSQTNATFSCFEGAVKYCEISPDIRESVSFYPSNRLQTRYLIEKGTYHGLCAGWYENGNRRFEEPYLEGRLNGLVRTWHENGALESQYLARGGGPYGIARKWDASGQLISVKLYAWVWTSLKPLLEHLEGLLLKEILTVKDIVRVHNAEVRRILIEDMGYERFLQQLNPQIIDKDEERELLRAEFPREETMYFVKVRCPSTGTYYLLRVPPTMTKAKEAVAWTFGLEEGAYNPDQET